MQVVEVAPSLKSTRSIESSKIPTLDFYSLIHSKYMILFSHAVTVAISFDIQKIIIW